MSDDDKPESDTELLARWERVNMLHQKALKSLSKMKFGGKRDEKARWCGCLGFTLGQIESEIRDRGLPHHTNY